MENPGSTPPPAEANRLNQNAVHAESVEERSAQPDSGGRAHLIRYLAVYTLLRLGLVVVLTAVLAFFMPLIVALLFAIIVQLPLAWLLFTRPRARVNDAIAVSTARRREERERLQTALLGESTIGEGPTVAGPPPAVPGNESAG